MPKFNLLQWRATIAFLILATGLTGLVGKLTRLEILPIGRDIDYSSAQAQFIGIWLGAAILVGVVLPVVGIWIWRGDRQIRPILGFYLFVLIVQIITEQALSAFWFPSLVAVTGTIYTLFRVAQLWQARQQVLKTTSSGQFSRRRFVRFLWILLVFWSLNLLVLFTISLPAIV